MKYPVICYGKECTEPAVYKIAARWSDGLTTELKTYGLACEKCLPALFHDSIKRQLTARTLPGEIGDCPGIYRLQPGGLDGELIRMNDLEMTLLQTASK